MQVETEWQREVEVTGEQRLEQVMEMGQDVRGTRWKETPRNQ